MSVRYESGKERIAERSASKSAAQNKERKRWNGSKGIFVLSHRHLLTLVAQDNRSSRDGEFVTLIGCEFEDSFIEDGLNN
jgi:hypothetical protein